MNGPLFLTPVAATAQLGLLFPSLRLVKRIDARGFRGEGPPFVLSQATGPAGVGPSPTQTIDMAFVFPARGESPGQGNLGEQERGFLLAQIPRVLEKDFAYRVVKFEFGSDPSFWYPFLAAGIVCCRLAVTLEGKGPCAS